MKQINPTNSILSAGSLQFQHEQLCGMEARSFPDLINSLLSLNTKKGSVMLACRRMPNLPAQYVSHNENVTIFWSTQFYLILTSSSPEDGTD